MDSRLQPRSPPSKAERTLSGQGATEDTVHCFPTRDCLIAEDEALRARGHIACYLFRLSFPFRLVVASFKARPVVGRTSVMAVLCPRASGTTVREKQTASSSLLRATAIRPPTIEFTHHAGAASSGGGSRRW